MNKNSIFILVIFVAATAIRLATIGYGTNVDEGVYWIEGKQIYDGYVIYRDTQFNKTPLVALVAYVFFPLGDTPIIPMRITMIAASILSLYIFWIFVRSLFDDLTALCAFILLAFEPFSCVWAKYLHTSMWAPEFEIAVYWLLITGLKQNRNSRILLSGIVLGLYALSKQTAIFVLPPAIAAVYLFSPQRSWKRWMIHASWWSGGILLMLVPFLITIAWLGALSAMWFDIWTAHHLIAGAFTHHTLSFRWQEWKSMIVLAPALWIFPIGSLLPWNQKHSKEILFVWAWCITAAVGNIIIPTHLWRHYFLVCMPPVAILAALFFVWGIRRITALVKHPNGIQPISIGILTGLVLIGWLKNDWTYPGLTLRDEQMLARHVKRYCKEPYMLNLTNPALYVWTDTEIPPAFQGERMTRIPFFMTLAGRGYLTRDDLQKTVDYWNTIPIGCVVAYDKYLKQIYEDPLMQPLRTWLETNFKSPQRVSQGNSYYGWFFIFEKK